MSKFQEMWKHHPSNTGDQFPCATDGNVKFSNQCSIRLGVALALSGYRTRDIQGAEHCWYHPGSLGHIIRAEEFARGLLKSRLKDIGPREMIKAGEFGTRLAGRTGIIFFKDYSPAIPEYSIVGSVTGGMDTVTKMSNWLMKPPVSF